MTDDNGRIFQGRTEAQLESIADTLREIKADISKLSCDVDALRLWRSKVVGVAAAMAMLVSLVVEWIKTHMR